MLFYNNLKIMRQQKITPNLNSVLASSDKPQAFDPKQMSSQIVAEPSEVIVTGNESISAVSFQQANSHDAYLRKIVSVL